MVAKGSTKRIKKLTKKSTKKTVKKSTKKVKILSAREKRFCIELVADGASKGCKEKAAIKAGYSEKSARTFASRLLKKVAVQKEIERLQTKIEITCEVTKDYVLTGLKEVAERCMQRARVLEFNYEEKRMVQKTCMIKEKDETIHEVDMWEFDSRGACKAFELLGRHLALFTDKHVITTPDDPAFTDAFFGIKT